MKIVTPIFSQNKTLPNKVLGLSILGVTTSLGFGFTGIGAMDLEVGEVFNVGTLTHYNKSIWGGDCRIIRRSTVRFSFWFRLEVI